jgi:hypothetical protein
LFSMQNTQGIIDGVQKKESRKIYVYCLSLSIHRMLDPSLFGKFNESALKIGMTASVTDVTKRCQC